MNILFVCTGNTCRSPLAEVLLRKLINDKNIGNISVKSCGLSAYSGCPVSENSLAAAVKFGCDLSSHKASAFNEQLGDWADKIIVMSESHKAVIDRFFAKYSSKTTVLGSGISDPYGGDLSEYERCAEQINSELEKLVNEGFFSGQG